MSVERIFDYPIAALHTKFPTTIRLFDYALSVKKGPRSIYIAVLNITYTELRSQAFQRNDLDVIICQVENSKWHSGILSSEESVRSTEDITLDSLSFHFKLVKEQLTVTLYDISIVDISLLAEVC